MLLGAAPPAFDLQRLVFGADAGPGRPPLLSDLSRSFPASTALLSAALLSVALLSVALPLALSAVLTAAGFFSSFFW